MSSAHSENPLNQASLDYPLKLWGTLRRRPALLLLPMGLAMVAGVLVALFGSKEWRATQAFLVREELIGRIVSPGRFESLDTMKTAQETIQEIARNPSVIRRTLLVVGPENGKADKDWPSEADIESAQGAITFHAPNGAEFGKTEVLMLNVKSNSRERARELAQALFREMQIESRQVRQNRAESMQLEIGKGVELASERVEETATSLAQLESAVGADLPDLRAISESSGGSANLKNIYTEIQSEIRGARAQRDLYESQLGHLRRTTENPTELLATPKELLELQPALSRLKDNLIDAQISRSNLLGIYTREHPSVIASENAIRDIKTEINSEVAQALIGVQSQINVVEHRIETLGRNSQQIVSRLQQLAEMRVEYAQLQSELQQRTNELASMRREFAQAESIKRAAAEVDFITPIDEPRVGTRPDGMSKKAIVLCATLAGTFVGIGFVVMLTPTGGAPSVPVPTPPATTPTPATTAPPRPEPQKTRPQVTLTPTKIPKAPRPDAGTLRQTTQQSPQAESVTKSTAKPVEPTTPKPLPKTKPEIVQAVGESFTTETKTPTTEAAKTHATVADTSEKPKEDKKPTVFVIPDLSQHTTREQPKQS